MPNLPILPSSPPEGFCPANWDEVNLQLVGRAVAVLEGSGFTVITDSETVPSPENNGYLWRRPSTGLIYKYTSGAWVTPHPEPPSGEARRLYVGTTVQLQTYDGGSIGAVGDAAGPMWEVDTDFDGRSPMGPGSIPDANPAKTLNVGEDYGEGAHTMTAQEVGPHTHPLNVSDLSQTPGAGTQAGLLFQAPGTGSGNPASPSTLQVQTNEYTTTQQSMPIIHPVRGTYIIRRTARIFYLGS